MRRSSGGPSRFGWESARARAGRRAGRMISLALLPAVLAMVGMSAARSPAAPAAHLHVVGPTAALRAPLLGVRGHRPMPARIARVRLPAAGPKAVPFRRPLRRRMVTGEATNASSSTNWSGLVMTGTGIQGAEGAWTVPAVTGAVGTDSATWVGVDGASNSDLIQTGTAQTPGGGYSAWWEILPAVSVTITDAAGSPAPVRPGDSMLASVQEVHAGTWAIYIADQTQGWYFQQNFSYSGPGTSAEWIEEAPTDNGQQTAPADFGTVDFSDTGVYEGTASSPGWYATDLTASNEIDMVDAAGTHVLAAPSSPSAPSGNGQTFRDSYILPPLPPTGLTGSWTGSAIDLTWTPPTDTGGLPIQRYIVERQAPDGSSSTVGTTTATSLTVGGAVPGTPYTFAVAAENAGAWVSPSSAPVTVTTASSSNPGPTSSSPPSTSPPVTEPAPALVPTPTVSLSTPASTLQLGDWIVVRYTSPNTPGALFRVRYADVSWRARILGPWRSFPSWLYTRATAEALHATPGFRYCFDVQAAASHGKASPWSPPACTAIPLAATALHPATGGWGLARGAGLYRQPAWRTGRQGATLGLAGAQVGRVAIVVTKCPTCGVVRVYLGRMPLMTVDTFAPTTRRGVVVWSRPVGVREAAIRIQSMSWRRVAIIEGLAVL